MTQQSGPGMVPLDTFVGARLAEDERTAPEGRAAAELAAKRRVLEAYARSKYGTMHRVGLGVALKALAGVWAEHPDYDPTWRL